MLDAFLVPENTIVSAKGDGPSLEISNATARVFLLKLSITKIIEQESLEIAIFGSPDGAAWDTKPIVSLPQKFYCGDYPLLFDLTALPTVKFVRAHWEVARWGRGTETPMFEFSLRIQEVPSEILRETRAEAAV
jgi:hypothetical protein